MNLTTVSKRAHVISKISCHITKVYCASQRNLIKETEIIKPLKPGVKNHITTKFIYLFAKLDTYKINAFPKHRNQLPMFNVPPIAQNGCTYSYVQQNTVFDSRQTIYFKVPAFVFLIFYVVTRR